MKKAWPAGSTDDLSLKPLVVLATGLAVWILYGIFKMDYVIIIANAVGVSLVEKSGMLVRIIKVGARRHLGGILKPF